MTINDSRREVANNFVQQVGGFAPGSLRELAQKSDVVITTPTPFAALCRDLTAGAQALLGPGQDHTALAQLSEKLAGTELGKG